MAVRPLVQNIFSHNSPQALGLVNTALSHTPTCIELYVHKGRIYKHAGDPQVL